MVEKPSGVKVLALNRKARFEFHILEVLEAGMVLTGAEIKSIRMGGISLQESYVAPMQEGLFLLGAHVQPYAHSAGLTTYDPIRPRKLLLHKTEINRLRTRVKEKGLTIVPLQVHLKGGYAKLEIALAKGKLNQDKRASIKEREAKREMDRHNKNG